MAQQIHLDLRKVASQYMKLTFKDGKEIELNKPSKAIFNMFKPLTQAFNELEKDELSETDTWDLLDTIYEICAKIMSHNRKNEIVSIEYLENTLSVDDLKIIFEKYIQFVNGHLDNAKN